jgi:hypothetical protein
LSTFLQLTCFWNESHFGANNLFLSSTSKNILKLHNVHKTIKPNLQFSLRQVGYEGNLKFPFQLVSMLLAFGGNNFWSKASKTLAGESMQGDFVHESEDSNKWWANTFWGSKLMQSGCLSLTPTTRIHITKQQKGYHHKGCKRCKITWTWSLGAI